MSVLCFCGNPILVNYPLQCLSCDVPLCVVCSLKNVDDVVLCLKCETGQHGPSCVACSKRCPPNSNEHCKHCTKDYCSYECYRKKDFCNKCQHCGKMYAKPCSKCGVRYCALFCHQFNRCVEVCKSCDTDPIICEFSPLCYAKTRCACRKAELALSIHVCPKHENFMTPYSCMVCRKRYRNTKKRHIKDANVCLDCYKSVQLVLDRMIIRRFPRDVINLFLYKFVLL